MRETKSSNVKSTGPSSTDVNAGYLPLASEFPTATREQWLKLVDGVLKGAAFDKKLVGRTLDGLKIAPLYDRDPKAEIIAGRQLGAPWQIMQRADHPDPPAANAEALHDLENGANGLSLTFAGAIGARGYGLAATEEAIARVLDNVYLDAGISLELDLGASAQEALDAIASFVKHRNLAPASVNIRFGLDPIGACAIAGRSAMTWQEMAPKFAKEVGQFAAQGFKGPFAVADGRVIHDAGGSEAQELAYVLAIAVSYLRAFEAGGIPLEAARSMIYFRLAADADQFLTMAKFRSLRKLWARVEEACGLKPAPAFIAAETAWRMMTKRDPWVNMLRTTIASIAAGLAGANSVTVLPYTLALGLPDRFARRIARNTQLILLEESNLAKVADPAAGAGGFEDLTNQLCHAAWPQFQDIEKAGGIWAALEQGYLQRNVAAVRTAREKAIAYRKDPLTGTSEFPNIHEAPVTVLMRNDSNLPPPLWGRSASETSREGGDYDASVHTPLPNPPPQGRREQTEQDREYLRFTPLRPYRLAEPFEALRDRSDQILAQTGARPKIFLANLGTVAEFTARATFAKNFFEAGGIEAVNNKGFVYPSPLVGEGGEERNARRAGWGQIEASPLPPAARATSPTRGEVLTRDAPSTNSTNLDALIAAFKASGAKLACLCSSDEVYAREAVKAATMLKSAGAYYIYVAGRPGEHETEWRQAGVNAFIFAGCDALATLKATYDIFEE